MTDYFELRDGLFRQYMKKAHWHCSPRGFPPFTRDVPSYTIMCVLETPDDILVESHVIDAIYWEGFTNKNMLLAEIISRIEWNLMQAW